MSLPLLILFLFFSVNFFLDLVRNHKAKEWVKTEGTVLALENLSKEGKLRYSYFSSGHELIGDNYSYLEVSSLIERDEILSSYEVGDKISVFVNPSNQRDSVIKVRDDWWDFVKNDIYFLLFIGTFLLASLWLDMEFKRKTTVKCKC